MSLMSKINKLLENRTTDKQFKIMYLSSIAVFLMAILYMLYTSSKLEESIKTYSEQKEISIIDQEGTEHKQKFYSIKQNLAGLFAVKVIKSAMGYGYLNYDENIKFLRNFSTIESSKKTTNIIKNSLKTIKILNGTFKVKIENIKIPKPINVNEYLIHAKIKQDLISETKNSSVTLYIKLKLKFLESTEFNRKGLYIIDFNKYKYDDEKHKVYFEEKKRLIK
jgi:hypothetical protein